MTNTFNLDKARAEAVKDDTPCSTCGGSGVVDVGDPTGQSRVLEAEDCPDCGQSNELKDDTPEATLVTEPILRPIMAGWAASGKGWAVHGSTREEAIRLFREAEERHRVIDNRPEPTAPEATLVERLRSLSRSEHDDLSIGSEAADTIERLQAEIAELQSELTWYERSFGRRR